MLVCNDLLSMYDNSTCDNWKQNDYLSCLLKRVLRDFLRCKRVTLKTMMYGSINTSMRVNKVSRFLVLEVLSIA